MRKLMILSILAGGLVLCSYTSVTRAEEMTITTYYPSPNGAYDALSVKRLSVGDTNGDGKINASDVSASSGYLLVADKVGIGTTSPGAKLEIKAGAESQSGAREAIRIWGPNTPGNSNSAQDLKWDFAAAGSAGIRAYRGGSWDTYLQFLTNDSAQGSDSPQIQMTITGSGNVGIGTASPSYQLTLGGTGTNFAVENKATFAAKNSSGTYENWMWPRWSDNIMYTNFGSAGWNIRNSSSSSVMFMQNNGNVGIGTTSPSYPLQVSGKIASNNEIISTTLGGSGQFRAIYGNYGIMLRNDGSNTYLLLTASGDQYGSWNSLRPFIIGNSTGYVTLSDLTVTDGVIRSSQRSNFYLVLQSDRNLVLYDGGSAVWASGTSTSDIRLKKNVKNIGTVVDKLEKIRAVNFIFKDDKTNKREVGVIAQELEKDFPELIYTDSKSGYKLVDYPKLTVLLLQAVKDLRAEEREDTRALSKEIKEMKLEIAALKNKRI